MFGLKSLFAIVTIAATITVGFLYSREVQKNYALRHQESEARKILNGYFLKTLLADQTLVGRRESDMPELQLTCAVTQSEKDYLASVLEATALSTETASQFPKPSVMPSDHIHLYSLPVPKNPSEGTYLAGFGIYVQRGVIIGIYPVHLYVLS